MAEDSDRDFIPVMPAGDLAENAAAQVTVAGLDLLLIRHGGAIYAIRNACSHQAQPLIGGRIRRGQIMCPLHGARFDLNSGAACGLPATQPIGVFPVREENGMLAIGMTR